MPSLPMRVATGAALTLTLALPLSAGEGTVAPGQTVFVPPLGAIGGPGAPGSSGGQGPFIPPLPGPVAGGSGAVSGSAIAPGAGSVTVLTAARTLSDAETQTVVAAFNRATAFCGDLPQSEYTVDCFAYQYWEIARGLPEDGEYGELREIVEQAATRLDEVVRRNRSAQLPPAVARRSANPASATRRPLIPVAPDRVATAAAEAAEIIAETRTVLLRSSENSALRRTQFQRVAAAMDTGTILLRSL